MAAKQWTSFFETFLRTPLRFKQDPPGNARIRKRGTPISYALSVVCGEVLLFCMDFAVNQRAGGLFLYRMPDDLWLWDAKSDRCAAGWEEVKIYADLVGLTFNESKTGSVTIGSEPSPGNPPGDVRWGFLVFDKDKARFTIDQDDVGHHIVELRRQLAATKSVFGWVNAYNKYMAFFVRNFGGRPTVCFNKTHTTEIIETLARIQRDLFPEIEGGAVGHLQSSIEKRFGMRDLPHGYFYLPISSGGLELRNPMIEMCAMENEYIRVGVYKDDFVALLEDDKKTYRELKEYWETFSKRFSADEFMTFEEYIGLRETHLTSWRSRYTFMLGTPNLREIQTTPTVAAFLPANEQSATRKMDWYDAWIRSLYGEEIVKRFGRMEVVDPTLIPVGMVQLFRSSRMKLDE